jgi:hypothetical protein
LKPPAESRAKVGRPRLREQDVLAAVIWDGLLAESQRVVGEINIEKWSEPMGRSARRPAVDVIRERISHAVEPVLAVAKVDGRFALRVEGTHLSQPGGRASFEGRSHRLRAKDASDDVAGFYDWQLAPATLTALNAIAIEPNARTVLSEKAAPRSATVWSGAYEGDAFTGLPWGVIVHEPEETAANAATQEMAELVADVGSLLARSEFVNALLTATERSRRAS